ncbi:MAG: hypothetical protein KDN22_01990 [Verrucomicrobiae bacterium]|nr:hypothetical protein [Verrucomicrobiae bacterium]
MFKKFAMCLALGLVASVLSAALKWTGAFAVPIDFLYGFYDQSPIFGKIKHATEFANGQLAILVLAATATALAVSSIPHFARRLVIVLGAVLITFFLSPVVALIGWKLEPFSWLAGILSAALSALVVFPGQPQTLDETEDENEPHQGQRPSRGSRKSQSFPGGEARVRTPEMAIAAAVEKSKPAAEAVVSDLPSDNVREDSSADADEVIEAIEVIESQRDMRCVLVCSVFPPRDEVDGYPGAARAFLELVSTFLRSAGASSPEVGPDFVRAAFDQKDDSVSAHDDIVGGCKAALLLERHLSGYREAGATSAARELRFGIGLETVTWNGTDEEIPVESKSESRALSLMNRRFGSRIVVGARAHRLSGADIEVRPLEMISDPTSGLPVEVYELLGMTEEFPEGQRELRDAFWEGIIYLRSNLNDEALKRFRDARPDDGSDPVLAYFEAVARGEKVDEDWQDSEAAAGLADEAIPAVLLRESDSVDAVEMFMDDFEEDEPQPASEKL